MPDPLGSPGYAYGQWYSCFEVQTTCGALFPWLRAVTAYSILSPIGNVRFVCVSNSLTWLVCSYSAAESNNESDLRELTDYFGRDSSPAPPPGFENFPLSTHSSLVSRSTCLT